MKLLAITALFLSLSASAARTYHSNDGSAQPGNPGTFTKDDANSIPSGSIQPGETSGVPDGTKIQKQEEKAVSDDKSSKAHEEGSLDMSTMPQSKRTTPSGDQVQLSEEEEE